MDTYTSPGNRQVRWPGFFLPTRAIGDSTGGQSVVSPYSWSDTSNDVAVVQQYTRLNVRGDFTNDVSAFVELDSYARWGRDFRSNYITGFDFRNTPSFNDVDLYQGYIEARNMFGYPVRMRIGRQELSFGSQWLVGPGGGGTYLSKRSFDGIRLTYDTDQATVDIWWSKLAENSPLEQDGDIDFYGVYGTYKGIENVTLDAYWMLIRDGRRLNDTNFAWFPEFVEDAFNIDNYDVTNLNTIGLRGAGTYGALDFNLEAAYQFGNADQIGFNFKPFNYGDNHASFDGTWGANAEAGYTFDVVYKPRVYVGATYFGGEDNRSISFWDWVNPFDRPQASVSFNRLFSANQTSVFLDARASANLSNVFILRGGVKANPTEATEVTLNLSYFESVGDFSAPRHFNVGKFRVPIAPALSFWDEKNSSDLGLEIDLTGVYRYSDDLSFKAGYSHLFVGDGLAEGNYNAFNGLGFNGGRDSHDADYVFFETAITF